MTTRTQTGGLQVASCLSCLVANEIAPDTGVDPCGFLGGRRSIVQGFCAPRNKELLELRESMQQSVDAWHRERAGKPHDAAEYKAFLEKNRLSAA